ncbi:LysR family transcriptional regulator [Reinekea thalattae]|uniref:LysR family transcriptional regulator n=1 Tax=Reinekea thalattae TaxID=2593301 RepID=A0A5C8ZA88_9GAMM|nr:LysR family transcriptional regulator [Reinekea thalattae]TXR54872.1 LysR family transcriptional regulator [Reinekea thalattae]
MKALLGQLSDTDIRLLRVFMVVAESGGLSAAEMELNIGRSTISRHLKDLETRLGLVLCRRGRSGFSLTAEGEQIYDSARRLLLSIEDFRHEINDLHQSLKGHLVLAMFDTTVTNPACQVHEAIAHYSQVAPDVAIDIHVVPINDIEKGVIEGKYHVGIIPPHRRSSSLDYQPLFGEQMYMYCSQGHALFGRKGPISTQEIMSQNYAGLTFSSPNMERGRELGLVNKSAASNQEGIATLIQSGCYIGFLPDHYAAILEAKGRIQKLDNPDFSYYCEFTAITRKSPQPTRIVKTFLQALEQTKLASE